MLAYSLVMYALVPVGQHSGNGRRPRRRQMRAHYGRGRLSDAAREPAALRPGVHGGDRRAVATENTSVPWPSPVFNAQAARAQAYRLYVSTRTHRRTVMSDAPMVTPFTEPFPVTLSQLGITW